MKRLDALFGDVEGAAPAAPAAPATPTKRKRTPKDKSAAEPKGKKSKKDAKDEDDIKVEVKVEDNEGGISANKEGYEAAACDTPAAI